MKKSFSILILVMFPFTLFAQVMPEWVNLFNGPKDAQDFGKAIAVDLNGNVFVAGTSVGSDNYAVDYVVVKYNVSGIQEWFQYYNGSGNWEDFVSSVAVDEEGNVYVTGGSDEGATALDYTTIKYHSSGAFAWKSSYSGLGSDDDDAATDIAVDQQGNVYVTGSSAGYSSSMWTDFATIKYSPEGDTIWTARFGGPGMPNDRATSITVDNYGFVYVTGYVEADVSQRYNYATVKYKPNGDTAWVRVYNGTGSDEDRAYAIALDQERNVYVTGTSWGILDDYATIKYDSNGVQQWVARYNGPVNSYDKAYDLEIDEAGNVYVTGASGGLGNNYDFLTIKYNNFGGEEWVMRCNGADNLNDFAVDLAIDAQGDIFVTGYSENAPSPFISTTDYMTVKYNSAGNEQWVHRYNGPGNYHDQGAAIVSDNAGNVYVTGRTDYYQQQNAADMATMKYAATNAISDPVNSGLKLFIYPNPTSGDISISSEVQFDKLEIYDVTGESVLSLDPGQFKSKNNKINLLGLSEGIYLVVITCSQEVYSQKIILK